MQLEAMAVANKATIEVMMERMNALVAAQDGKQEPRVDKENTPSLTNASKDNDQDNKPRGIRHKKTLCPHCKALVYHKPDKCHKLEANKDKRWVRWKLVKETTA